MDIGGTFTDVVAYDEATGRYSAAKSSTTPHELTEGVFAALSQVVDSPAAITFTVHGTTQGINAFLQRRGARVSLLVTEGTGDVYQIARGPRRKLYSLHYRQPEPLVSRGETIEIPGRLYYSGEERSPLNIEALRAAAERFSAEGFESIAVAFLFSYRNPVHELRGAGGEGSPRRGRPHLPLAHGRTRMARVRAHLFDGARRYTGPTVLATSSCLIPKCVRRA